MNLALLNRMMAQPWAIRRETLALFTQLLMASDKPQLRSPKAIKTANGWIDNATPSGEPARQLLIPAGYVPLNEESACCCDAEEMPDLAPGVTCILAWGTLGRAWSQLEKWWLDAVEVDHITSAVAATPRGSTVAIWFRSPGGISTGIPETAQALRELGMTRNLVAFTDDLCASAAYWLAAQCGHISATHTAELGSIGVYLAYYDFVAFMEKAGVKLELFRAGSMKGTGLMGKPLSDEERAHLQQGVLDCYEQFTADILHNRAIADAIMQGQTLCGGRALAANLADTLTPSAAEFFAALPGTL